VLRVSGFTRSSTVRIGAYAFLVLAAALCLLSFFWFQQTRTIAEQDMRGTLSSYRQQLGEGLERYGGDYGVEFISRALANKDAYLMLGIQRDGVITGNIQENFFAAELSARKSWVLSEEVLLFEEKQIPVRLYRYRYSDNTTVVIGYNLSRFADMRALLWRILMLNLAWSLVLAALLAAGLLWLVSLRLRPVNRACAQVMRGDFSHRLPAQGARDQFDQLAGNFNAMLDWIEALLKTSRETADSLAHDLRAPLSRVRLQLAELGDDAQTPAAVRERVQRALLDLDRLVRMFGDVLTISRADAGVQRERFAPVDAALLLADLVELYAPLAEDKGGSIVAVGIDAPLFVEGDRALLAQAMGNLLDNAIKYAPGTAIEAGISLSIDTVLITVADKGEGIPSVDNERVLERFVRLDSARSSPGFGLGLSFVAAIVRLHLGSIQLEDNQPGLKVTLRLPKTNPPAI
jgi:signal transduction histidine kinase